MKIVVISDSHDNIVRLKHVLGFAKSQDFAAVIHCGDWNTPLAVWEVGRAGIKTYGVLGNADIDSRMIPALSEVCEQYGENFLDLKLNNRKIGVCHYPPSLAVPRWGKVSPVLEMNKAVLSGDYDVLFYGHTHTKKDERYLKTRIINPGALHRTDSPGFAVYDTGKNKVEFVEVQI